MVMQHAVYTADDERRVALARQAQMETHLKETEKRPQELMEANKKLEKRLEKREKEAKWMQERASKAEVRKVTG